MKLYTIAGEGQTLSFSLLAASWSPSSGMSGPTSSARLVLDWPQPSAAGLELPLLSTTTTIGLNRPLAQIELSGTLDAKLETSAGAWPPGR